MSTRYPNVAKVELIAQALGSLSDRLVFVGGCAVDLLLTDPAATAPRVTYDVDLLVEAVALPLVVSRFTGGFNANRFADSWVRQSLVSDGCSYGAGGQSAKWF